jgi:hypothetical protein
MQSSINKAQTVQQAAHSLFLGCAPERKADLEDLWKRYQPEFKLLDDAGPDAFFTLEAGLYHFVRINHRAMRAFWFAGFIAWEGYCAFSKSTSEASPQTHESWGGPGCRPERLNSGSSRVCGGSA